MDQHLADLVGGIGVFALLRVVVLKQEVAVAVFDDGLGVGFVLSRTGSGKSAAVPVTGRRVPPPTARRDPR